MENLNVATKNVFDQMIVSNMISNYYDTLTDNEMKVKFTKYVRTQTGKSVKTVEVKEKPVRLFYYSPKNDFAKSAVSQLATIYGVNSIVFKLKIQSLEEVIYNGNKFRLELKNNRIWLSVNGLIENYWTLTELSKRSHMSKESIITAFNEKKILITFGNSRIKNHGTHIRIK